MKKKFVYAFKRNETYIVALVIGTVFLSAMFVVGVLLKNTIATPPYESLNETDLRSVYATGYLRFREDDGTPYLKVELHNGSLWWIKNIEFQFDGQQYLLRESEAFRPLHFGAVRCTLKRAPERADKIEYDLKITKASGFPPSQVLSKSSGEKSSESGRNINSRN